MVELFSNEKQVTDKTPPMFLAHAKDDTLVVPDNSRMLYEALKAHKVAAEYLELPSGGHGLNGYKGPDVGRLANQVSRVAGIAEDDPSCRRHRLGWDRQMSNPSRANNG